VDFYWIEDSKTKPIVLFLHGFKGFKDWGHWQAIARVFAERGFCFVAMNFSHNGTTLEQPTDFADLEAFGQNNYSKELADVQAVIEQMANTTTQGDLPALEAENITLIGHSRGGPIALITAVEQTAVRRVVTWASVDELNYSWANDEEKIAAWKKDGVVEVYNGRTKQNMPLYYQLYEDYQQHKKRLSVQATLQQLDKPYLIVHGTADPGVPSAAADYLAHYAKNAYKKLIQGADHVFGGKHPFEAAALPAHSLELVQETLDFITQNR
jgi:pimeloyl-ACP methyl ester carboxylesterase